MNRTVRRTIGVRFWRLYRWRLFGFGVTAFQAAFWAASIGLAAFHAARCTFRTGRGVAARTAVDTGWVTARFTTRAGLGMNMRVRRPTANSLCRRVG